MWPSLSDVRAGSTEPLRAKWPDHRYRDTVTAPVDRRGAPWLAGQLGSWRSGNDGPGYRALADRVRLLVLDGRVPSGTRLPAERDLAGVLAVSRGTVTAAYDRLEADGYLARRRGAGSWTTLPTATLTGPSTPFAPTGTASGALDLTHAATAAPLEAVHAAAARAVDALPAHLLGHGYDLLGLTALRERIAERYTRRGLPTRPDQVLVTGGAQHALMLALRTLVSPGDRVLVEHPTYPNALEAVRRGSARPVPVPLDDDGWDTALLARTLREASPRLAYLVPDHQNPTGHVMPDTQRAEIADVVRRSGTALVVDETLVDLRLDGPDDPSPTPMAALAPAGRAEDVPVITLGSASKTLWAGLRIGWLRAPRSVIARVAAARASVDMATPVLEQLIVADLLPRHDALLAPRLATLRAQRDHLLGVLSAALPTWRPSRPSGGLFLWVDLGAPVSSAFVVAAARHDLTLAAGPVFGIGGAFESHLRLPFVHPTDVVDAAVPRLAAAWQTLDASATTTPTASVV